MSETATRTFEVGDRVELADRGSDRFDFGRCERFTGVIETVIEPTSVCDVRTFCIRRDVPALVNGFVRTTYWATESELERDASVLPLAIHPDLERFEAQR